jgi:hypothetical protein
MTTYEYPRGYQITHHDNGQRSISVVDENGNTLLDASLPARDEFDREFTRDFILFFSGMVSPEIFDFHFPF